MIIRLLLDCVIRLIERNIQLAQNKQVKNHNGEQLGIHSVDP
ncbi:hypothetical protein NE466_11065 [Veillonella parvula]|nr:hypothetical protein [Veillonella parvula]